MSDGAVPERFTLRLTAENGDVREVEISAAQALDVGAGAALGYAVRDEELLADDGHIIQRESAIPPKEAA